MHFRKFYKIVPLLILLIFVGCEKKSDEPTGHRVKGFVMSGEQGNASPIEGIRVYIENTYVEEVFVETHTSSTGQFVLYFSSELEEDMEWFDPEYWFSDYKLIVEDENGHYYKRTLTIPQMSSNVMEHDYGIIFMQNKK